ncbi:MAG: hypothetical protein ACO3CD_04220 [Candidatus Nanopelagicaceae bacterium]
MIPATAPNSLKLSWENALSFESSVIAQNYYGGVDEKGNRNQINQITKTQSVSLVVPTLADYTEIDNFLVSNLGKPFYFDSVLYMCDSFKWSYQSDKVFSLDLTLTQCFRP